MARTSSTPISLAPRTASLPAERAVAGGRTRTLGIALGVALGIGALAACSPKTHVHGYAPKPEALNRVQVGADTRSTVQQKLGRPSTLGTFDDTEWYYISMRTETLAFYEPEVVEQQVVLVSFDTSGLVTDVGRYGIEDGQVVDLVSRTTPTSGRRLTVLQQIFQNLGRFGGGSNSNIIESISRGGPQ